MPRNPKMSVLFCFVCTAVCCNAAVAGETGDGTERMVPGTVATHLSGAPQPYALAMGHGLSFFYATTGLISLSIDGQGSNHASHVIKVRKPNEKATVLKAFVLAASNRQRVINDGDITINGNAISWDATYLNENLFHNVQADVTSLVKPIVDAAAAGNIPFTFAELSTTTIDGEILAVVFEDPEQVMKQTVCLLFGGLNPAGDRVVINLNRPIDPSSKGMVLNMGLGISFGYQSSGNQHSTLDVNGKRLSSWAGGNDAGTGANGALLTVGGCRGAQANPPDPYAQAYGDPSYDNEYYNLLPFISKTDTEINIATGNSSHDDNIFFAHFLISDEGEVDLDTDGDGLLDDWEEYGYDADGDGIIDVDLPAMGANKLHKDIFVEIDWMANAKHTHKPKAAAVRRVVNAFGNAPVKNPDGVTGITVHFDTGEWGGGNAVVHDGDLNPVWSEFDVIKAANFSAKRSSIFHYCLFAHNYSGGTSSGISRGIPASDFIVSLGSWDYQVGTVKQQTGTLMHELGHNLGLRHGGLDHVNYKPNFISIMNYFFQMSFLRVNGVEQKLDYSRFKIRHLDENHLNEPAGLDRLGGDERLSRYGTKYFNPSASQVTVNSSTANVDWNANAVLEMDVAADINHDQALTTLTGLCNEWQNIVFNGGSIGPGVALMSADPIVFPELTYEEYRKMESSSVVMDPEW